MTCETTSALCTEREQNTPRRILFVCTGNTCRSPMAAALLNDMAARTECTGELLAASAGLFAADGEPITPAASRALQRADIPSTPQNNYMEHRAATVTVEHMAQADLVVGLTRSHAMQLLLRFPESAGKITCFPMDIQDPFGGSDEIYSQCLLDLRAAVCEMFFDGGTP